MNLQLWPYLALLVTFTKAETGCIQGISHYYSGERSVTASGLQCQRWDVSNPHKVIHFPSDGGHHHYCRNPDRDMNGTWCYTTDPNVKWEYCGIAKCASGALIIWNSVDDTQNISYFSEVEADPEIMYRKRHLSGQSETHDIAESENSRFKALSADHEQKLLYFTDVKGNYFGVYDMNTRTSETRLEGMVEHIEAISYDWITKNIYWTDSRLKSIMVAESTLQSYNIIYKPQDNYTPYALEVNSVRRLLIFSVYMKKNEMDIGSKILSTDLAGQNEKVLLENPQIGKVIGLTIDSVEDRIYWVEPFNGGSKVVSARMDGTDIVQHYIDFRGSYYDIAVFSDYVYISDTLPRYNVKKELRYHVQIVSKNSHHVAHYKMTEKPMGISAYALSELYSKTKPQGPGECTVPCVEGICLPTLKGERKCVCSIGYQLEARTNKCVIEYMHGEYLLVVDANQGNAYQMTFDTEVFSLAPFGGAPRISSLAYHPSSERAYFSTMGNISLKKGLLGGECSEEIAKSDARYIEIDPLTGNVFYSDGKSIIISSSDGSAQREIVSPEPAGNSDIKAFALDNKNKYLYWTNTFMKEDAGKLMRCRFDGSSKVAVLENLNWPHGVAIDFETDLLYVMDSRIAMVHELPLNRLKNVKAKFLKQRKYKKHDLRNVIKTKSFQLTEIKVHEGFAYIIDVAQPQVQKFDLSREPFLIGVGPAIFYKPASMSVYSIRAYSKILEGAGNPCKDSSCDLCVEMKGNRAKCLKGKLLKRKHTG